MREFFDALIMIIDTLTPYALTYLAGCATILLGCWVLGCFSRKNPYMPPRRIPSTGHKIEGDLHG